MILSACWWCRVSVPFHFYSVYIIFSAVCVAEWAPAHSVDHMGLCILTICNFSYFPFWF